MYSCIISILNFVVVFCYSKYLQDSISQNDMMKPNKYKCEFLHMYKLICV